MAFWHVVEWCFGVVCEKDVSTFQTQYIPTRAAVAADALCGFVLLLLLLLLCVCVCQGTLVGCFECQAFAASSTCGSCALALRGELCRDGVVL
jgi:hypothetical protein